MPVHEAVVGAHVGEALPLVARHAAEDRAFAVHDLVVAERQDEVLEEGVVQPEQDIAVVVAAMDRVLRDVIQGVVHPPHVPLVAEAQAAPVDRPRHHRPRRRLLGDGGGVAVPRVERRVGALEEFDGVDVLAAAVAVRNPAAGRPAVVEIEHRGDRIDAQPVDAVALQPEQRVRRQEVRHLDAAVVVDQRAPVEMAALHRVGVLVERGAVEMAEPVRIVGEMPRHPVEQHARGPCGGRRR